MLSELDRLSRTQLLDRWRELYRKPAPTGLRRELMIPFLAYRIQENLEGGLSAAAKVLLKSAKRQVQRTSCAGNRNTRGPMKPGTRILRRWKGAIHEVDVTETAYQYRDHEYRSLSEIARIITGTRWSGPAFFGLRRTESQKKRNHE